MKHGQLLQSQALNFITGGKAIFTILNIKTGNRFTYRVIAPHDKSKEEAKILWVSVLTGPDNTRTYSYIGCLHFRHNAWIFSYAPAKARLSENAPSVQGFAVLFNQYWSLNKQRPEIEFYHEGKCCRCGRKLTVPTSISSGIGPECASIKINHSSYNH